MKRGAYVRTCSCTPPPQSFVKHLANGSLTTHQISAHSVQLSQRYEKGTHLHMPCGTCRCAPPFTFVKCLANGSLTTHQISAQSVQSFQRYRIGAHLHVHMFRCTPPMTCVICITSWSLNTHQIWSQSAETFLSYSLAANFETLYAARASRQGDPQMSQI